MKKNIIIFFSGLVGFAVCMLAYLYIAKTSYVSMPITLGYTGTPLAMVTIQGKEYPLEVDFGSKSQLVLTKDVLSTLEKKPYGVLQGKDLKGNSYDAMAYLIPKIKIGGHVFENVIAKEINEECIVNTTFFSTRSREDIVKSTSGFIGRGLLEKMNLLLDVRNAVIIECDNGNELQKIGYPLDNWVVVSFDKVRTGIVLIVNTDLGKVRLSLDTASTWSLIRSSLLKGYQTIKQEYGLPYFTTSKFEIKNKDFGGVNLHLFDIAEELHEIDGILGMDFLKNHVIYINYRDQLVYIGDSQDAPKG